MELVKNEETAFVTIDDLMVLAENLYVNLQKLSQYKYPLSVRKGVKNMNNERESITVKAIGRMYFLDLKETRDKKPYLVITESRSSKEGDKRERSSIMIFQEDIKEFGEAVANMVSKFTS